MTPTEFLKKNLKNTPFATDRLLIWAIGVYGLIGMVTIAILALRGQEAPDQLQSSTMFILGVIATLVKDLLTKGKSE